MVIELKRDAVGEVVLSQSVSSYVYADFICVNMLALNGGRPEQLNLKDIISAFVAFREEVVKRTTFLLIARARAYSCRTVGGFEQH